MNEFLETLKSRRSIRRYKAQRLPEDVKTQLLESVQCTQSWHNSQCWELVIIEDPEFRKQVQQSVPQKNPAYHAIVDASLLIAVCGKRMTSGCFKGKEATVLGDWLMYDLGLATQNLCNAAHSLGLGTVVVGWFDHVKVRELIKLPEGYEVVSLIPLGYPDQKGSSPKRKDIDAFVHTNTFKV